MITIQKCSQRLFQFFFNPAFFPINFTLAIIMYFISLKICISEFWIGFLLILGMSPSVLWLFIAQVTMIVEDYKKMNISSLMFSITLFLIYVGVISGVIMFFAFKGFEA